MPGKQQPRQLELGAPPVPDPRIFRLWGRVTELIDLEFVRGQTRPCFAADGRPALNPVLMVKRRLVGYLFGLTSDRERVDRCADRLAFRDFLHLGAPEPVPSQASFTYWRQRRGAAGVRQFPPQIVRPCRVVPEEVVAVLAQDVPTHLWT